MMNNETYVLVLNNAYSNANINKLKDQNAAVEIVDIIRKEHLRFIFLVQTTIFYHAINPKFDSNMLLSLYFQVLVTKMRLEMINLPITREMHAI